MQEDRLSAPPRAAIAVARPYPKVHLPVVQQYSDTVGGATALVSRRPGIRAFAHLEFVGTGMDGRSPTGLYARHPGPAAEGDLEGVRRGGQGRHHHRPRGAPWAAAAGIAGLDTVAVAADAVAAVTLAAGASVVGRTPAAAIDLLLQHVTARAADAAPADAVTAGVTRRP